MLAYGISNLKGNWIVEQDWDKGVYITSNHNMAISSWVICVGDSNFPSRGLPLIKIKGGFNWDNLGQ